LSVALVGDPVRPDGPLVTGCSAELYNVDIRQDQRYMAEHDIFPCGERSSKLEAAKHAPKEQAY